MRGVQWQTSALSHVTSIAHDAASLVNDSQEWEKDTDP